MKKWLGRLTKIGFFLFAFLAVVVTVLFNMGGNSDTLKGAIEEYVGQATGFSAQIQSFNKMTFFPNISVDMEGILLKKPDIVAMQVWAKTENEKPKEEQGKTPPPINYSRPDASIDTFKIAVGFWDVGLGKTRKIRDIQVKNAHFNAGSIAHKAVRVSSLGIDETAEGKPFLNIEGDWGGEKFAATINMEASGSGKGRKYFISEESAFEAMIGKITMQGIMRPRTMGGVHIRDLKVMHNTVESFQTTFSLVKDLEGIIEIQGNFSAFENGSSGAFDWQVHGKEDARITGNIEAEIINPNDFNAESKLSNIRAEWDRIFKDPTKPANDNHDITVSAKNYQGVAFEGKAVIQDNQINFEAMP